MKENGKTESDSLTQIDNLNDQRISIGSAVIIYMDARFKSHLKKFFPYLGFYNNVHRARERERAREQERERELERVRGGEEER